MPRAAVPPVSRDLFDAVQPPGAARSLQAWDPGGWPVDEAWRPVLERFLSSPEGERLAQFVSARLAAGAVVFPPQPLRALQLCGPEQVRAVILGQDPYHGPGQAQGLAFSVPEGLRLPPSLRNILRECDRDLGSVSVPSGDLQRWARQGVLLLNTALTVEQGRPGSHAGKGWEALTHMLIRTLAETGQSKVFMAWGAHAQALLTGLPGTHLVLCAHHPSPLSASRPPSPFIGCGHFSAANRWLVSQGREPITW
ncbi:MAG: uracil-DNA glycosylase [Betaproteobacteria bacterium]|nr:uracil-DNA glycosylase [Betaproteobacteria bacterium]